MRSQRGRLRGGAAANPELLAVLAAAKDLAEGTVLVVKYEDGKTANRKRSSSFFKKQGIHVTQRAEYLYFTRNGTTA